MNTELSMFTSKVMSSGRVSRISAISFLMAVGDLEHVGGGQRRDRHQQRRATVDRRAAALVLRRHLHLRDFTQAHEIAVLHRARRRGCGSRPRCACAVSVRSVNSRCRDSMRPAGSSMFSLRSAVSMSETVMRRAAMAPRSSHTRME